MHTPPPIDDAELRLDTLARLRQVGRGTLIERRGFIKRGLALLAGLGLERTAALALHEHGGLAPDVFWATVRATQQHLFPDVAGTPGIEEINATAYLAAALIDPGVDGDERQFIVDGVPLLDEFTRKQLGRPFFALDAAEREVILRHIEKSAVGKYWLSLMIYYILEALLVDPVYGGNLDGVGWRWLAHVPGFPRPPTGFFKANA